MPYHVSYQWYCVHYYILWGACFNYTIHIVGLLLAIYLLVGFFVYHYYISVMTEFISLWSYYPPWFYIKVYIVPSLSTYTVFPRPHQYIFHVYVSAPGSSAYIYLVGSLGAIPYPPSYLFRFLSLMSIFPLMVIKIDPLVIYTTSVVP